MFSFALQTSTNSAYTVVLCCPFAGVTFARLHRICAMQWGERDAHVVVNGLNHLSGMTLDAVSMNNALTAILWGDGNQQVPEAMWDSAGQLLEKWVQSCNGDDEESIRAAIKVINSHKVRCGGAHAAAHTHRAHDLEEEKKHHVVVFASRPCKSCLQIVFAHQSARVYNMHSRLHVR